MCLGCRKSNPPGTITPLASESAPVAISVNAGETLPALGLTPIAAGSEFTCAIREGAVWCWGENIGCELGIEAAPKDPFEHVDPHPTPVRVQIGGNAIAVAADRDYACALREDGRVVCWGSPDQHDWGMHDDAAALPAGPPGSTPLRSGRCPPVLLPATSVRSMAVTSDQSCLLTDKNVLCWGDRSKATHGTCPPSTDLGELCGIPADVASIAASPGITCALIPTGETYCAGWDPGGLWQIGFPIRKYVTDSDGAMTPAFTAFDTPPVRLDLPPLRSFAFGNDFACGIMENHRVACWGDPPFAKQPVQTKPVEVDGLSSATQVVLRGGVICAVQLDGAVFCWGRGGDGMLGNGTTPTFSPKPVRVHIPSAIAAAIGGDHVCALGRDARVWCWGKNRSGAVGSAELDKTFPEPRLVELPDVASKSAIDGEAAPGSK